MKRIAVLFALVLIMAGCVTSKRCFDKFPPEEIYIVDTVSIVEVRDTIIEKEIPGDTVIRYEKIVVINDSTVRVWRPVEAETEYAQAKAWMENDIMKLRLIQKDSILRIKIDSAIRVSADTITVIETTIHEVETTKPLTKYVGFWVLIGAFILFALAVIFSLLIPSLRR